MRINFGGYRHLLGAHVILSTAMATAACSGPADESTIASENNALTTVNVKINFQPSGSPVPSGYLADTGAVYGDRGNGYVYGFDQDSTSTARDRNSANSPDQRYDTFNHMQLYGNKVWEIAVPNGTYTVHLVSGDPDHTDSVYQINVEGVLTVSGTPTQSALWVQGTRTVTVTDGKLTVTNASGSTNNKLGFIEIATATSSGGTGGATGSGGATGTGGKTSTGGTTGSGGTTSAGSTTGSGGSGSGTVTYSTNFDLTESPISEKGAWTHLGQDWTTVATQGGYAYGTQALAPRSGASVYNDSYAYLTKSFPANQSVSAVIHLPAGIDTSTSHEVELLLHWADGAHTARGYECNLSYNGYYAEIVRWNGALGSYTYLTPQGSGGGHTVHDGDVFSAQIVGNKITTYLNGVQLNSATDSTFTTGQPGIGLYRGANGAGKLGDYGFSSFSAKSL